MRIAIPLEPDSSLKTVIILSRRLRCTMALPALACSTSERRKSLNSFDSTRMAEARYAAVTLRASEFNGPSLMIHCSIHAFLFSTVTAMRVARCGTPQYTLSAGRKSGDSDGVVKIITGASICAMFRWRRFTANMSRNAIEQP